MKQISLILNKHKQLLISELKSYALVLAGALILAIAYAVFIVPYNIMPGGIFGLSIIIHEFIGVSIGTIALLINIPLLIWGTKLLGNKIGFKTSFLMVAVSFLLDLLTFIIQDKIFIEDALISSVFGGMLIGVAIAIVKYAGATTGGNDILVRIISTKVKLKFSQLFLTINAVVIIIGVAVFQNYTLAAYSIITIIAMSKTVDYFINKNEENKTFIVFSNNNLAIQEKIAENRILGSETIKYIHHDSETKMILITKNNKKLHRIEDLIYSTDKNAQIVTLTSK